MSRKTFFSFLTLALLAVACSSADQSSSSNSQAVVTDTLGFKFSVDCSSGLCLLTAQNSAISPLSCAVGSGSDMFLLIFDPILTIYAVHVPTSGEVELNAVDPAHPVACTADADCLGPITVSSNTWSYMCQSGICQLAQSCTGGVCSPWDGVLLTYDVLALCQADLSWPGACPYLTSQPLASRIAAVADVCGSNATCPTVPAACRQLKPATGIDGGAGTGVDSGT
jgi:hypothetical protein